MKHYIVIHRHSKKRESTPSVDNSLRHQLSNIKELLFLNGILFVFLMTCKLKHILIMQGNHANGSTWSSTLTHSGRNRMSQEGKKFPFEATVIFPKFLNKLDLWVKLEYQLYEIYILATFSSCDAWYVRLLTACSASSNTLLLLTKMFWTSARSFVPSSINTISSDNVELQIEVVNSKIKIHTWRHPCVS